MARISTFPNAVLACAFLSAVFGWRIGAGVVVLGGGLLLFASIAARGARELLRRRAWAAEANAHRAALTRRYRQTVRLNDYGARNMGKWEKEVGIFLDATDLIVPPERRADFAALVTARVEGWIAAEDAAGASAREAPSDPLAYEDHCADLLREAGWSVTVTAGSGDQGVDVLASQAAATIAIQCKRYNRPIGNKAVQEAHAGKGFSRANAAAVVSNQDYTASARRLADELGVLLLHHSDLPKLKELLAAGGARR